MTLFRPVGRFEFEKVQATGFRAFPPRLPEQPIFYPVTSLEYARQIARDWNTRDTGSGQVGIVLRFRVEAEMAAKYPVRTVGQREHAELWVPAEELGAFNAAIDGLIEIAEIWWPANE